MGDIIQHFLRCLKATYKEDTKQLSNSIINDLVGTKIGMEQASFGKSVAY